MISSLDLSSSWLRSCQPRDRRPIYEWARCLDLQKPYTLTGRFNIDISRHFIEPLDALQSDYVREVNIRKPVRSGGSLIGDLWFAWAIENDPDPFLNIFQTDPIAESHWKQKLHQFLKQRGHLPVIKGGLNWKELELRTGAVSYAFGPSINGVQSRGIRFIRVDELWLYDGILDEAKARMGDYVKLGNSKLCVISQGGPKPGVQISLSDWHAQYHSAEIREWHVKCQGCGHHVRARFFDRRDDGTFCGIRWDAVKDERGQTNKRRALETIRFECPECGHPHLDTPSVKNYWNNEGKYVLMTEPDQKKKSFTWQAVIDNPWEYLVDEWLDADIASKLGNIAPKIAFKQKFCAEDCDEQTLMESDVSFRRSQIEIVTTPEKRLPGEIRRFLTVDKQQSGEYWWAVRAWFAEGRSIRIGSVNEKNKEKRTIGFGSAFGELELLELQKEFGIPPNNCAMDAAFEPKGDRGVYAFCAKNGWIALRGDEAHHFPFNVVKRGQSLTIYKPYSRKQLADPCNGTSLRAELIRFSKPVMNKTVKGMIEKGIWQEPMEDKVDKMANEYQRQMAQRVERFEYARKTNQIRSFWWEGRNDHACDLANMQTALAMMAGLIPDIAADEEKKDVKVYNLS